MWPSASGLFPRVAHAVAGVNPSCLFLAESCSVVWMDHTLFIPSPVEGHLGCFYLLTIVNNATINIGVEISVQVPIFQFFWVNTQPNPCLEAIICSYNFLGILNIFLLPSLIF